MTGGAVGEVPEWYTLCKAADWLGCKPWELGEVNTFWYEAALIGLNAEASAEAQLRKANIPA